MELNEAVSTLSTCIYEDLEMVKGAVSHQWRKNR